MNNSNTNLFFDKFLIINKIEELMNELIKIEQTVNEIGKIEICNINNNCNLSCSSDSSSDFLSNNCNNTFSSSSETTYTDNSSYCSNNDNFINNSCNIYDNVTVVNIFDGVKANSHDEITDIITFFNDNSQITNLLNKINIHINNKEIKYIQIFMDYLISTQNNDISPIKNIINSMLNLLDDGKLNLYDVPKLINIIISIINSNLPIIKLKINTQLVSFIIKILIHLFLQLSIIHIDNKDSLCFDKLIDSSLSLLQSNIKIPKSKFSLFACCFNL
jgi:hypothetical protein